MAGKASPKTTGRQFQLFKTECQRWQKEWGLLEWSLNFEHGKPRRTEMASCEPCFGSREAYLKLSVDWSDLAHPPTDENVRETAKHEMIHLLIAPLEDAVGQRYITKEVANDVGHAVLQRLMKLL